MNTPTTPVKTPTVKTPPYTDIELKLFEHFKAKGFEIKGADRQKFKKIVRKHSERVHQDKIDKSEGLLDIARDVRLLKLDKVADLYLDRASETLGFNLEHHKTVKLTDLARDTFADMINRYDDNKRPFSKTHPKIFKIKSDFEKELDLEM